MQRLCREKIMITIRSRWQYEAAPLAGPFTFCFQITAAWYSKSGILKLEKKKKKNTCKYASSAQLTCKYNIQYINKLLTGVIF